MIVTTSGLKNALVFSFQDKKWGTKYLIGGLLILASMIIPVIPILFVLGYAARIIRRITNEDGQAALPEWNNWGDMLVDGLRIFGLYLIYLLPGIILMVIGYLTLLVPAIGGHFDVISPAEQIGTLFVMWILMALGILWTLAASFLLQPAAVHMVAKSRFGAGFEFSAWWKILGANIGGFVLALVISMGLAQLLNVVITFSILTIGLIILLPVIAIAGWLYTGLVTSVVCASAYREGLDALAAKQAAASE